MMGHVITTPRSTGSPLLLILLLLLSSCCLHLTFADVSSAIPATFIRSSIEDQGSVDLDGNSAISLNPCGTLETGCTQDPTAEFQLPHQLLEKRSSYELRTLPDTVIVPKGSGGLGKLETAPGYRVGNTGNKVNRPAMDSRPIWNAPFRVVYGSTGRNLVKFGKRSATNLFDGYRFKFGKRSVDVVEKRMIKFGKRIDTVSDDQDLSSAEEDKRMIKFGKRADDLQAQEMEAGEEKRLIRFGKRVGDLQDDQGLESGEEKRLIRFGKRVGDLQDDQSLEPGEEKRMIKFGKRVGDLQDDQSLESGEEKRLIRFGKRVDNNWSGESKLSAEAEKRMIKFGKRFDHLTDNDDQNNSAGEEKRMFKLGKRIDDDPQGNVNLVNEEEKRKFSFGKRILDTQIVPNLFGEEEARISKVGEWSGALPEAENLGEYEEEEKRMIKFGKKAEGFNDGKQSDLEAQTKEIVQYPDEEGKRMIKFGKKKSEADVTPSEDVKRKIMFGKRSDANWDNGQKVFDDGGLNSMETDVQEQLPPPEKRRQKFQFGRRLAPRQDELFAKVRSKFKLGKRSE